MIVTKDMWKTVDIPDNVLDFTLYKKYTEQDMDILRRGRLPLTMDDKWFWYFEENKLYMHRSWTGFCDYIVEFNVAKDTHKVIVNGDENQLVNMSIYQHRMIVEVTIDWWLKHYIDTVE